MYTYGRKTGCRISLDYTYRGMRIAYLENEAIRVGVLLGQGGGYLRVHVQAQGS